MIEIGNLGTDPAAKAVFPALHSLKIGSGGETLLGVCLTPGGDVGQRHPAMVFLHGFPGYDQNVDLAYALRRMGMVSVYFHYRGSWGSSGDYRLSHLSEDAAAVLQFLRENAELYAIDTSQIFVFGHSMGGFAAMKLLSDGEKKVRGAILMAPCDVEKKYSMDAGAFDELVSGTERVLRDARPEILARECAAHPEWLLSSLAEKLDSNLPMLLIGAERDEVLRHEKYSDVLAAVLEKRQKDFTYRILNADHSFSGNRIELARLLAQWLNERLN